MSRTVVITQSNYLPWRGYFDLLRSADEVILLDSVQYTRRDWRNRNRIKTAAGCAWITIPVEVKGRYLQSIDETRVSDPQWAQSHRRAIEHAYRRAPHYAETAAWLDPLLADAAAEPMLSRINEMLVRAVCSRLGLTVRIRRCTDLLDRAELGAMDPTARLANLAAAVCATRYLSGPAAKAYLDAGQFESRGIAVDWMSYDGYPDYPQLWGGFEPAVSIVDLLMNTGAAASSYLDRGDSGRPKAIG